MTDQRVSAMTADDSTAYRRALADVEATLRQVAKVLEETAELCRMVRTNRVASP